ncbi:hypothetical protein F511_35030 [Dorcoceras hygrometricum]|uniref:Uncharacterized protein n=1 Tax=Dorcoceras hygrometricum TaxID=472368 RepID=A0A2Z7CYH5_9LAMI|nr:hypothetical protein F511_35030 [Dorcoceras hygrometricum]
MANVLTGVVVFLRTTLAVTRAIGFIDLVHNLSLDQLKSKELFNSFKTAFKQKMSSLEPKVTTFIDTCIAAILPGLDEEPCKRAS